MTLGADNFADAPVLALDSASDYTLNATFTTEVDEPSAWGGKTAWWKFTATTGDVHWVDAFYSKNPDGTPASARVWIYSAFSPPSSFADLFVVDNPGADTRSGFVTTPGRTYWIRVDSDGAEVYYCVAMGPDRVETQVDRYPLTAPRTDPAAGAGAIREDYFDVTAGIAPGDEGWNERAIELAEEAVSGAPGLTEFGSYAEMKVGQFVTDVVDEYPGYHSGLSWYGDPPDTTYDHPRITFAVASDGVEQIEPPDAEGWDSFSQLVVVMSSSAGPPLETDGGSSRLVDQIRMDGEFTTFQPVRYIDENGVPVDTEVDVPGTLTEFLFRPPATFANPTLDYNNGTLEVLIVPNLDSPDPPVDPIPAPVGIWRFSYVALQVTWSLDVDYYPPDEPPFEVAVISVVRQFPRDDAYGWGSSPRIFPPPRSGRIIGGHQ